jgi:hypothetical protein
VEHIRTPERQETPESGNLRPVHTGRSGCLILFSKGLWMLGLGGLSWDLVPRRQELGQHPALAMWNVPVLEATETLAFSNWPVNLCIVFRL